MGCANGMTRDLCLYFLFVIGFAGTNLILGGILYDILKIQRIRIIRNHDIVIFFFILIASILITIGLFYGVGLIDVLIGSDL